MFVIMEIFFVDFQSKKADNSVCNSSFIALYIAACREQLYDFCDRELLNLFLFVFTQDILHYPHLNYC